MRRIVVAVIVLISLCQAQQTFTAQMVNGRGWQAFSDNERTWYVSGIHDYVLAELLMGDQKPTDVSIITKWASGSTIGDYVKELNRLYRDPANLAIPVALAMNYCTVKLNGKTSTDLLEIQILLLRDTAKRLK